jgi:hypothetical protein
VQEFREKKRWRKFLYSNWTVLGLLVIAVVLAKGTWGIYVKEQEAVRGRTEIENQVASLQARQVFLQAEVKKLGTESGVEREIREKFDVKKPGEDVVVIVNSTTTAAEPAKDASIKDKMENWVKAWFH